MHLMGEGIEMLNEKSDASPIFLGNSQNNIADRPTVSYQHDTVHYHIHKVPYSATAYGYGQELNINAPLACESHTTNFWNDT